MRSYDPRRPLPPTYVNERERIEEHDRFMNEALAAHPEAKSLNDICPDCYLPGRLCGHVRTYRT